MLTLSEINLGLLKLKDWDLEGNAITKKFIFENSLKVMEFVSKIVSLGNELNHNPDITISENIVKLTLTTKSLDSLTKKDFEMAEAIDRII